MELEEELKIVGNNVKSLEVSEEKALEREAHYEDQIRNLAQRLKEAETRAQFAERSVLKLQKEIDRMEDDLVHAKEKNKVMNAELDQAFQELSGYWWTFFKLVVERTKYFSLFLGKLFVTLFPFLLHMQIFVFGNFVCNLFSGP